MQEQRIEVRGIGQTGAGGASSLVVDSEASVVAASVALVVIAAAASGGDIENNVAEGVLVVGVGSGKMPYCA